MKKSNLEKFKKNLKNQKVLEKKFLKKIEKNFEVRNWKKFATKFEKN